MDGQLTSLTPDGTRQNTKVYAGQTVIAEQYEGGNTWKTSDPVTGSEATYSSDGTGYVEEVSALGQKVSNLDPAEISDPPPNEMVSFWENMEWQCEIPREYYGSFTEMPFHCQIRQLMSFDKGLADIYGFTQRDPGKQKRNPTKHPHIHFSSSDKILSFGLSAASKPFGRNGGQGEEGAPCSVPGRDGESYPGTIGQDGKCRLEGGSSNVDVAQPLIDMGEIQGYVGADGKPGIITFLPDEREKIRRIQEIIEYARDQEDCTKAFRAVNAVPIGEQEPQIRVVTESVFNNPQYDKSWTNGSDIGTRLRVGFAGNKNANDVTANGVYKETGLRLIGITTRALKEKDDFLDVTIIHAFVHSGGVPGKNIGYLSRNWEDLLLTGFVPPDLHYLGEKYEEIIRACTKTGTNVKKAKSYSDR